MKITADTNILISATFWYGASNEILNKVERKEIELILSLEIIEEFVRILNSDEIQQKIKNKNLEMNRTVEKIIKMSTIIEPKIKLNVVKDDPSDNKFLECAKAGNVNYLVSNDKKHLLKLKEFEGIKIVSPEEFLDAIV